MLLEDGEARRRRNKRELVDARLSNPARCRPAQVLLGGHVCFELVQCWTSYVNIGITAMRTIMHLLFNNWSENLNLEFYMEYSK